MNYSRIIKDSFQIVLKHRFLWLLGIFIGGSGYAGKFASYNPSPESMDKAKKIFNLPTSSQSALNFFSTNVHAASQKIFSDYSATEYIILGLIALLVFLVLIYVSITARGAIIFAVSDLAAGKESNLKSAWGKGHRYFWRRLSFALLLFLFIMLAVFILALPAIIFGIAGFTIPAVIFGVLALLIFIIGAIYLSLVTPIGERALFLNQLRPVEAIKSGFRIFNLNWTNFVILFLIIFGAGLLYTFALMIALIIPGIVIFLIGYLIYLIASIAGYVIGGILVLALLIILIALCGAFQAFSSSVLTLGFLEVKNK